MSEPNPQDTAPHPPGIPMGLYTGIEVPVSRGCSLDNDLVRWLASPSGMIKSPANTPRANNGPPLSRDPSLNKMLFSPPAVQRQESVDMALSALGREADRDSPGFLQFVSTCLSPITKMESSEAMAEQGRNCMLARALKRSWSDRSIGLIDSPGNPCKQPKLGTMPEGAVMEAGHLVSGLQPLLQHTAPVDSSRLVVDPQPDHAKPPVVSPDQQQKAPRPCKCRKSKCLKLYCECFSGGNFCTADCSCVDCGNICTNPEAVARARNPRPRLPKVQGPGSCRCKRSGCQKKYCECYQAKAACTDRCHCVGCRNTEADRLRFSKMVVKDSNGVICGFVPQILNPAPS